jgi:hypothetical protein
MFFECQRECAGRDAHQLRGICSLNDFDQSTPEGVTPARGDQEIKGLKEMGDLES